MNNETIIFIASIILTGVLVFCLTEKDIKERTELISNIESNTRNIVEKEYQMQAVSNNFAHWEVNSSGEVTFKWNTN
jgi:hypothetical protein